MEEKKSLATIYTYTDKNKKNVVINQSGAGEPKLRPIRSQVAPFICLPKRAPGETRCWPKANLSQPLQDGCLKMAIFMIASRQNLTVSAPLH